MSETTKTGVGKEVMSLDVSPQFNAYSGVEIIVDEETSIFAGNRTGRVLEIENPWGTQRQAQTILNSLQARGLQYQPYKADGAMLNPAAEIGDGITISDVYSGIYKINRNYTPLMAADLEAPQDEEVDHEYPYEPKQDRIYRREIAEAKAEIAITQDQISSEVTRATNAENSLSSQITQTADSIKASVLSKKGGATSSFGWTLTDSSWNLYSNGTKVLKCDADGLGVKGTITATSGKIGGFTIGTTSLYNKMTSLNDDEHNGVYVGTDGIALGKGKFKVTSSGTITATGIRLQGTLTFLNSDGSVAGTMSAANLRQGAAYANAGHNSWDSAYTSTSAGGYCYGGAQGGYSWNSAKVGGETASYFRTDTLVINDSFTFGGSGIGRYSATINGVTIPYIGWGAPY